jgi:hypothetical protein
MFHLKADASAEPYCKRSRQNSGVLGVLEKSSKVGFADEPLQ